MSTDITWHTRRDNRALKTSHPKALRQLLELMGQRDTREVIELAGATTAQHLRALAVVCEGGDAAARAELMEIAKAVDELGTVYVEVED